VFFSSRTQEEVKRMSNVVKMNAKDKVAVLNSLLAKSGRVMMAELITMVGTARRARSAVFKARRSGLLLEAVRGPSGKVESYVSVGTGSVGTGHVSFGLPTKTVAPVVAPTKTVAPAVKPVVKPVVKPTDAAAPVVKPAAHAPSISDDDLTIPDFLRRVKTSSAVAV